MLSKCDHWWPWYRGCFWSWLLHNDRGRGWSWQCNSWSCCLRWNSWCVYDTWRWFSDTRRRRCGPRYSRYYWCFLLNNGHSGYRCQNSSSRNGSIVVPPSAAAAVAHNTYTKGDNRKRPSQDQILCNKGGEFQIRRCQPRIRVCFTNSYVFNSHDTHATEEGFVCETETDDDFHCFLIKRFHGSQDPGDVQELEIVEWNTGVNK